MFSLLLILTFMLATNVTLVASNEPTDTTPANTSLDPKLSPNADDSTTSTEESSGDKSADFLTEVKDLLGKVPSDEDLAEDHDNVQGNNPYQFPSYPVIELTETNHIVLRGEITEQLVSKAIVALNDISEDKEDIMIYITSPGGSVLAGNNFIQFLNFLRQKGKRIIGIADQAASMAFSIFQECDVRYVTPSSILMQHQMSVGLQDQYENLKNRLKLLDAINRDSTKRQAARIGLSEEEFESKVLSDWWIFGSENVDQNTADAIVQVGCSRSLLEETVKETVRFLFMTADLVYSKCPISRAPLDVAIHGGCDPEDLQKFKDDWLREQSVRVYL